MNHLIKIVFLATCMMLCACSKNPLQQFSAEESALILSNTCTFTMKQLGFNEPGMSNRYAQCMDHQASPSFDCERLFVAMTTVLNKQGIKVRMAHLTDHKFYDGIKEELKLRSYFSM